MEQEIENGITFANEELNYKVYVPPTFITLQWNRPETDSYLLVLKSKLNSKSIILENFTDYEFPIIFEEIANHNFSITKLQNMLKNENIKEYFTIYEQADDIFYYKIIFKLGNAILCLKLETENSINNIMEDINMKYFEEMFESMQIRSKKEEIQLNENNKGSNEKYMNEQINNLNIQSKEIETTINNEYDYSNIVPSAENIGSLVQYCDSVYSQLLNLIAEDESKNMQLREEYKNYTWKKHYNMNFETTIKQKNYNTITCKNYSTYQDALNSGQLNQLSSLAIDLNLSFKRGEGLKLQEHQNSFKIVFKPYEISFIRKSNYNDSDMNQIEETIKNILGKFQVANSIFCSK